MNGLLKKNNDYAKRFISFDRLFSSKHLALPLFKHH